MKIHSSKGKRDRLLLSVHRYEVLCINVVISFSTIITLRGSQTWVGDQDPQECL